MCSTLTSLLTQLYSPPEVAVEENGSRGSSAALQPSEHHCEGDEKRDAVSGESGSVSMTHVSASDSDSPLEDTREYFPSPNCENLTPPVIGRVGDPSADKHPETEGKNTERLEIPRNKSAKGRNK